MADFMGASALCGGALNINGFIVGRAIVGVGGCGMYMGLLTLLSVTTTNNERPKYLSLTGFIWGIGTVLGPVVGSALGDNSALWRWAFYLNLLVSALARPIDFIVLPDFKPLDGTPFLERTAKLDFLGALLSIGSLLCITMAMNLGGVLWGWGDGGMLATFGSFIGIYYLSLYHQFTRGISAVQISVHLLPFILFLVAFNFVNGQFMASTGTTTRDIVDEHTNNAGIYGFTIILGTGVGSFCQAGFATAQMKVKPTEMAYSVGFKTDGQMLGIVFSTSMSRAVFVNYAQQALAHVFPDATKDEITNAIEGV
ncbi:Fc.00g114370.m01.CDS01 [Cosmosporella sp. VM-42]